MSKNRGSVVVFGGSGAVGSAIAEAFAREGAHVFIGARTRDRLDTVADRIRGMGGRADAFVVDVLDGATAIEEAMRSSGIGPVDVVVNATGFPHVQGRNIDDLTVAEFMNGFEPVMASLFNISKAVRGVLGAHRGGAFITIVAPAARMAVPGHLGHIVACAGVEAFCKALASEVAENDIRVVCLRSHAIPDAVDRGSHTGDMFVAKATTMGLTLDQWLGGAAQGTMLKRLPTLSQVADTVVFLASERAAAMTATVINMTAGAVTD